MLKNIKPKMWFVAGAVGLGMVALLVLSLAPSPKPVTKQQGYVAFEPTSAAPVVVPVVPAAPVVVAASAPAEIPLAAAPTAASSVAVTAAVVAPVVVAAAPVIAPPVVKPAKAKVAVKTAAATPELDKLLNNLDGYLKK